MGIYKWNSLFFTLIIYLKEIFEGKCYLVIIKCYHQTNHLKFNHVMAIKIISEMTIISCSLYNLIISRKYDNFIDAFKLQTLLVYLHIFSFIYIGHYIYIYISPVCLSSINKRYFVFIYSLVIHDY